MKKQLQIKPKPARAAVFIKLVLLVLAVPAVSLGVFWVYNNVKPDADLAEPTQVAKLEPKITGVQSRVLFLGNTFWGRYINDWSNQSGQGVKYPFSRLHEFERDKYDAWISGLECPTVAGDTATSAEQEETLSFNCPPSYLPEAAKWFTAFTLANNHTDNRGAEGFTETKEQLTKNGIQYFGHYDPRVIDEVCGVVQLPVRLSYDNKTEKTAKLPVVFCGYHGVFMIPSADSLAKISEYSEYLPVFAMPHMGAEYKAAPDEIKTNTYHAMIDNGAEMVIGDHPHWIQTTEVYNGKLIVYSMGNFMFDQQYNAEVTRSAAIDVTIKSADADIEKWVAVGGECGRDAARCLQLAKDRGLKKLNLSYDFDVVGTDDDSKIAHKATDEQLDSIKQRLNWDKTAASLSEL
ncbi:MAG: CapA family protein [Candidatus Nomurabacteria bacterium]|jgi:poly-gamma-glutamate synthesis protein (capsule biosynthesis protein)|nr:CapA family protein [Candidatus Nomurabacteria bacterium]